MREYYKFDIETFKPLLGKFISGFHLVEDYRYPNSIGPNYQPHHNRFEGIENLIIWYYLGDQHYSLRLYSVENGRFAIIDSNKEVKTTYYGIRSIGTKSNEDLRFGKKGSIRLKNPSGFTINGIGGIKKIQFYQEVHKNLNEYKTSQIIPKLEDNTYFPDRIIIESDSMYIVIRAEEDYDQNLLLKSKVGFLREEDEYFKSGYDDKEGFNYIKLDEIN